MKLVDALTVSATALDLADAANDETGPTAGPSMQITLPPAAGWDPFEVWRTRVRDARRVDRDRAPN